MSKKEDKKHTKAGSANQFFKMSENELRERAQASVYSVVKGNTRRLEEFVKEISEWKAKRQQ